MLSLMLVALLQAQDKTVDVDKTKLLVFDSAKGYTLRILEDGKVELTVREEDKTSKLYSAASAEEFRSKHPDLMKKYELGRHLGGRRAASADDFDEWWRQLRKGAPGLGPIPGLEPQALDEDLQRFMEEQKELFRGLRRGAPRMPDEAPPGPPRETPPRQAPIPGGREFGVNLESVGETLRDQLSLKEGEGVLVAGVKPGTAAEKAGLKPHDILLRLEGKPVQDRWQFRADVLQAMGKPEFEIELLRAGKRETVKVKSNVRKDE